MNRRVVAVGLVLCLCGAAPAAGAERARGLTDADGTVGPLVFPMVSRLKSYEPIFMFDPGRRGKLSPQIEIRTVAVAGTFNDWKNDRDFLQIQPNGTYRLKLDLPRGFYQYKFLINGEHWIEDPAADPVFSMPDNYGGMNSGIYVGEVGKKYGKPAPADIRYEAVRHDFNDIDYANVEADRQVRLRVRVLEKDVETVTLHYWNSPDETENTAPLRLESNEQGFDYYSVTVKCPIGTRELAYCVEMYDGARSAWLGMSPYGQYQFGNSYRELPVLFQLRLRPRFRVPDWARHVVWYQIMLDRFRNGDPANDPTGVIPWTWDWGKPHTADDQKSSYSKFWSREFGGDLQGLIASLDYLEELGVTGIYLNPIFEAKGYSKYNTGDERHVDDNFGVKGDVWAAQRRESLDPATWTWTPTDTLFLKFLGEAHARGFKVILDGVFNHCGEDHWAFRDVVSREKESPYADWFVISDWDVPQKWPGGPAFEYKGWHGFGGLPEYVETDSGLTAGVRAHLFNVTRRWMDPNGDGDPSDGVDGWRLDAADDVDPDFWADWRALVKDLNPNAFIAGEIWKPAPELLRGAHFDALMNYQFAMRAVDFFVNTNPGMAVTPTRFHQSLEELLALYPTQATHVMMNLFASHDVDRLASMIKNPNRPYNSKNRLHDNPSYDISRPADAQYEVVKLMATFQMTFPGAPLLWYGDEAGMFGSGDPANRQPMWWADLMPYDNEEYRIQTDIQDHTKRVISIRNTYPALRTGSFAKILTNDGSKIYAFERREDDQRLIIVLNNDKSPHTVEIPLSGGGTYLDLLDPASARVENAAVAGIGSVRNLIRIAPDAPRHLPENGRLKIDLRPKGAAVLLEIP